MTFRAIRILQGSGLIAAEDTRHTRKLLTHFDITPKRLVSYHEHNKQASGRNIDPRACKKAKTSRWSAMRDCPRSRIPGADLVQAAIAKQIPVVPIPGANAALSALIISGTADGALPVRRIPAAGEEEAKSRAG